MIQVEPYCANASVNPSTNGPAIKDIQEIMALVKSQQVTLSKEVAKYTAERASSAASVRTS